MLDDNDFALASADDTSAEVLEELSLHPQPEVREAVARNPNTPTETLLKLGKEFPDAITANPIFNLLLLENPESHFVRLSLARSTTTSESAIARLSEIEDEEILCAVARNPKTPLHILEQLVENPPLFCEDENADESDFDRLFTAIAQNPNTSESLFLKIAQGRSWNVEIAIAENPKAPFSLLNTFADWRNFRMHKAIARNPQVPSAILEKLAGENEKEIREMVKNHPNVSETAIAIINFMEGKPGTSIDLLERLASDKRAFVRLLVAAHSSTPAKVLEKLAQDTDKDVPFKAASNPNATSTVLEFFAEFLVKQRQLFSPNQAMYERSAVQLVKRSDITPKVLENLLQMNEYFVVNAIASSLKTPANMLLALTDYQAQFVDIHFLINLAQNPNTPPEGLEKLYLRINQTQHPNTSDGLHDIVTNPNTPVHLLEQFAVDSRTYVRANVAKNVNIPISILERLSNDSNSRVSRIAKQALKARA
jgi:predicted regulator of amino acid metabolism with ACT domain